MTQADWEIINQGAQLLTLSPDEIFLTPSECPERIIYRVVEGVVKAVGNDGTVRKIKQGGFFGLEPFFLNNGQQYTVSGMDKQAKVLVIPGYLIDILGTYNPRLCGKFYLYLANELLQISQATYKLRSNQLISSKKGSPNDKTPNSTPLSSSNPQLPSQNSSTSDESVGSPNTLSATGSVSNSGSRGRSTTGGHTATGGVKKF